MLAESIANKFDAKKIFLFGSFAYGELQARSDLDFCIITDLGKKRKIELIRDIRREISQISQKPIDILL